MMLSTDHESPTSDLREAAERWRTEGWVLIDRLIGEEEIAAAVAELPVVVAPDSPLTNPSRNLAGSQAEADGAAFRGEQFSGTTLFPLPDASNLNRLFVHPRLVDFAAMALQTDDLRLYQSRVWSKYAGRVNYEQPLHRDMNHSLLPTRSERGWWHLECFLYLTDVDTDTGAPKVVPRSQVAREPSPPRPQSKENARQLYDAEIDAVGRAGSLFAYRSDVWHRGVDITRPGAERHVLVAGYKPGGLEWVGYDPHPPLAVNADFADFVAGCGPRELALFGVPLPGHPYWTAEMVEEMSIQYPGLDLTPWRRGLSS